MKRALAIFLQTPLALALLAPAGAGATEADVMSLVQDVSGATGYRYQARDVSGRRRTQSPAGAPAPMQPPTCS